jgi:hypothetical protein
MYRVRYDESSVLSNQSKSKRNYECCDMGLYLERQVFWCGQVDDLYVIIMT